MSPLRASFLAAFIGGLVLAVFAMLHGLEHMRRNHNKAPSPFFNLPAIAAFAVGFGAVGYPIATRTHLPGWAVALIAIGGGVLAISGMISLLAFWALRGGRAASEMSETEELQGQLAVVTTQIGTGAPGEISYEFHGERRVVAARTIDGSIVPSGAEVVIDHIEDNVAFVEAWAVVEQRL
jgi:hypothetical protein